MGALGIDHLWPLLCSLDRFMLFLLVGAIAFSITLVVLLWTRWGHIHSLEKCVLLSFLAHALLTGYAATVQIASFCPAPREQFVRIALVDGPPGAEHGQTAGSDPTASSAATKNPPLAAIPADKDRAAVKKIADLPASKKPSVVETVAKPQAATQALKQLAITASAASGWQVAEAAGKYLRDFSTAHADELNKVVTTLTSAPPAPASMPTPTNEAKTTTSPVPANASSAASMAAESAMPVGSKPMPETYKLRVTGDHVGAALAGGGSKETEAAVLAALQWLAANQSEDGRWEARRNGAGRETTPDGRSRPNAGADADTGMTGLALLAMLGAGNTHLRGAYPENVRHGLNFLLQSQDAQGCLSGSADHYAAMYCHAIATFALGEAYGMTGERRLEQPLRRAINYTIAAQDPYGGGWRYKPHDAGDTSQLGWQFMALRSAETAGIPMPETTRQGIIRYLQSVASHGNGGLASYRPLEPPNRTMTAEAMLCWQFLGLSREHPACDEAANYLLSAPPGVGRTNFYYWYYGTLVMHHFQGDGWQRWNTAVATQLVGLQNKEGPLAGSWDPDSVWGGYGGRIYSTALGAMCLEVYYRFLPVYKKRG
ncbi:MAG: hypothetical protein WCJ35_01290 [Planctomycetota bacterium]